MNENEGVFVDNHELARRQELQKLDIPTEIITIQRIRLPQKNIEIIKRKKFLLIGIVASVFVLIASVSWISVRLVGNNKKIGTGGHYHNGNKINNNNGTFGWLYGDDDFIDWHSTPAYETIEDDRVFEEGMVESVDILLDDLYINEGIEDPTISYNNYDDSAPIKREIELGLFDCPPPGDPLTIELPGAVAYNRVGNSSSSSTHRILLGKSLPGILCTLLEVSTDAASRADRDLRLTPIGRSYNGGGWESYKGLYSDSNIVPLSCSHDEAGDCLIVLPPPSPGRQYVLKSYGDRELGPRDTAARFLERTTFGPTTHEIDTLFQAGNDPTQWLKDQLKLPVTSHRQFFRERATNLHPETTWMGTLSAGPCNAGARYRRFVFVPKDIGRTLTIETSPFDPSSKLLRLGGHLRSVIPGGVKRKVSETIKLIVPDGSYEICSVGVETSIGRHISIKVDSECYEALFDDVAGNPIVKLDEQHIGLAERLLTLNGYAVPVMQDFFSKERPQMMQLIWDAPDGSCGQSNTLTGAPESVTIASIGNEYWIHTPSFELSDNRLERPLADGGKSMVEATATAPGERMRVVCSNAPRTFLNEDDCYLSHNACSFRYGPVSTSGQTVVCGSPYEVASRSNPDTGSLGRGSFDLLTQYNRTLPQERLQGQRETVWLQIALRSKDQLRQRMAWALSQILVVSPNSLQLTFQTESFLTYYDIFVRNAFGNYFDVLKEVTYSPLMAEMLTYNNGVSTGHAWIKRNKLHHADENYARELLQLFSLGLHRLNDDGTIQKDANGHEIRTYRNHDISEYAKVFVGFKKQSKRGNIEDVSLPEFDRNEIDPLQIIAEHKDHFPKLGMGNRYVGDGYPLCKDLPPKNFLKKGATFRLLGSNPNPELLNDPEDWLGSNPVRISLDKSSILSTILCNKGYENCRPRMKVVLDSDIQCIGVECTVEELRTFEIIKDSGIWYEYVRPPCVNHVFYDGAQSIRRRWGQMGHAMCGDPGTLAASTVCCQGTGTKRREVFSGERVSFDIAQKRCSYPTATQELCNNPFVREIDCRENGGCDNLGTFYWSSSGCSVTAKINGDGKIAVIHNPEIEGVDAYRMFANDTKMYFRVDWLSDDIDALIPTLVSNCEGFGCTYGDGNTCICSTSIQETPAFINEDDLISVDEVLSLATIGSFDHTDRHDTHAFQPVNGVRGLSKYPSGALTPETVFRIVDSNSQVHFRKNTKNEVHLGTGAAKFRNPITFYSPSEPTTRDAAYETDATLQHAFYHENMAPFLAVRLAQRFGDSNPSPRYVRSISTAFRRGLYTHSSTGMEIGSGQYGCLQATVAAVLLDKETLDPILDADPTHGSIQEPYLKIVRVLRSLEFKPSKSHPLLTVGSDLLGLIGQQSHKLPNVFSFFKPEYQPAGRISSAGMRSPESEVLSGPTSVQMMNTIISHLKYGSTSCYGGFGSVDPGTCKMGATTPNGGDNSYDPTKNGMVTASDIVDDLATLLTSGRLDRAKREIIKDVYEDTIARGKSSKEALINVQQLIVASPEFHSTNVVQAIDQKRALPAMPEASNIPYKAVIFVMLPGGYDSFNVLVPKTCNATNSEGKTVREQYLEERGSVAFNERLREFDLDIDATDSNQPCSEFAIHDELKIVKELYDDKDLAFFANAGVINNQGMTKHNYHGLTRSQLFAHNAMQHEIAKVDPYDRIAGTGIMGRAKDVLSKQGHVVGTISIDEPSIAVDGKHGESHPATTIGRNGSQEFAMRPGDEYDFDIESHARTLNGRVDEYSGIFGETWSQQFITGIDEAREYQSIFDRAQLQDSIWTKDGEPHHADKIDQEHWEKWNIISKLIQRRDLRKADRDLFFTELGSWDHHNAMKGGLRSQLRALNYGLEMFVKQAKSSGFWDDVAVVIASDFGRTFTPNSNEGTDHGWGGNYMILGGDVAGGQILGEFPSDLTPSGPLVDDRGRFLPTTSWDSIWNGILEWTGVTEEDDLDYCLPNRFQTIDPVVDADGNFPLFTADSIFRSQARNLRGAKK